MSEYLEIVNLYILFSSVFTSWVVLGEPTFVIRPVCMKERSLSGCSSNKYSVDKTYFYLFTSRNTINPEPLHKCDFHLPSNTNFNKNNPTVFIIHGYTGSTCSFDYPKDMKTEFLKRQDYNVILVDWAQTTIGDYYDTVRDSDEVSDQTVVLIKNIMKQTGLVYKDIHLIGQSFGAHIAGQIGNKTRIGRITGLEPGGAPSHELPASKILDRNDADLVDIIHTNAGRCLPDFGYLYPVGDEDFYVGNGMYQPGCFITAAQLVLKGDILHGFASLALPTYCYHFLSVYFFIASINPDNCYFIGKYCENYQDAFKENCNKYCNPDGSNCAIMGLDWALKYKSKLVEQRVYSVEVGKLCPYCVSDTQDMKALNLIK